VIDAQGALERIRARTRSRNAPVHDWRLTLLPAAIEAGLPARALRLCKALCDHQRGRSFYPEVIIGLDQLAEELGVARAHVIRDNKRLVRAGVLTIISGGGRLTASRTGRANVYQLSPRLMGEVEAVLTVPKQAQITVPKQARYPRVARTPNSADAGTPTPRGTSYPLGGSGDRTAALTGGSPPTGPSPEAIAPHRFRDLLGVLHLGKRSDANAL
jgi:hypothetical protein